ncbi:SRPBCC family protein [Phyllobacterium sp. NPDC097923]
MTKPRFVYVTYIRTTPEKLWHALIDPEFTRQYWAGTWQDCDWQPGSSWKLMIPDGRVGDAGEVVEIDPPKRLVLSWRNEFLPELKQEGFSRLTYELDPMGDMVKLTVVHEMDRPESKLIEQVSTGWPSLLSSLKSLLETGESLEATRHWPKDM